jgi:hypothetical protein
MEEGQIIDPKQELVTTKCAELLAESIPGENYARRTADSMLLTLYSFYAQVAFCKCMFC